jgi:acyl-CoA thioester hydrolase
MTTMTTRPNPTGAAYRNAHVLCCPTRWSDVDENGHINNARLVGYVQEGIYDLFHHHHQAVREALFPAGFLIARHEIDYLEQLYHGPEPLLVRLTVERIGRSSTDVRVDVCRDPFTYMTARTVVVARDHGTGRSRRLTLAERRFLADHMTDGHLAAVERTAPPRVTPKVMPQRQSDQLTTRPLAGHQNDQPQHGASCKVPAPRSGGSRALCRV